jgi:hypothetical protein
MLFKNHPATFLFLAMTAPLKLLAGNDVESGFVPNAAITAMVNENEPILSLERGSQRTIFNLGNPLVAVRINGVVIPHEALPSTNWRYTIPADQPMGLSQIQHEYEGSHIFNSLINVVEP